MCNMFFSQNDNHCIQQIVLCMLITFEPFEYVASNTIIYFFCKML